MKWIPPAEREWVEYCLAVMAIAPDTRDDYAQQPVGMVSGVARPEFGLAMYDLQCQMCGATWVGVPGDPCTWCEIAALRQVDHQTDLLLTPPDIDPDDVNYENRMEAWVDRMNVGIDAGLITERQAATALRRTQMRRSA